MLLELAIKNFSIIEEATLHFNKGMTVLTGETGAGKSIIIDAVNMILGRRATVEMVRSGASKSEIKGHFLVQDIQSVEAILSGYGIELKLTPELIIHREILVNGRNVSRLNGQLVNLSVLKDIGEHLVDISGQHDREYLRSSKFHISLLDSLGGDGFVSLKTSYQETFDSYSKLRKEVSGKHRIDQDNKARIEMLAHQISEIEEADLQPREDEELQQERDRLLNHKYISDALMNTYALLKNENFSILENIRIAMNNMESIEQYANDYRIIATNLSEIYYVLEDITRHLESMVESLDFDSNRLLIIENRLNLLQHLSLKYGSKIEDVLNYFKKIQSEYNFLMDSNVSDNHTRSLLKKLELRLIKKATEVSHARHKLAKILETEVKKELQDLYMGQSDFSVQFNKGKFHRDGNEQIEFYISTNPGESLKPFVKIISGGELSRFMLAIKSVFRRTESKTSMIFDEIDTGVSGRVAQAIAQKLYHISLGSQVIVISHVPQVVAIADQQFLVEKSISGRSTVSTVRLLSSEERTNEIAKMLAGDNITHSARRQAKELLKK